MSGKTKRREDDGASDGESEGHAPSKKIIKKDSDEDSDTIIVCEISKNRRVSVRNWQGRIVVDIREFYVKDGKQMPGKKGHSIGLNPLFAGIGDLCIEAQPPSEFGSTSSTIARYLFSSSFLATVTPLVDRNKGLSAMCCLVIAFFALLPEIDNIVSR
ncbi:RNA polymerase II transcriptional coactivator KIWI, partial [Mucuna pruriens]